MDAVGDNFAAHATATCRKHFAEDFRDKVRVVLIAGEHDGLA